MVRSFGFSFHVSIRSTVDGLETPMSTRCSNYKEQHFNNPDMRSNIIAISHKHPLMMLKCSQEHLQHLRGIHKPKPLGIQTMSISTWSPLGFYLSWYHISTSSSQDFQKNGSLQHFEQSFAAPVKIDRLFPMSRMFWGKGIGISHPRFLLQVSLKLRQLPSVWSGKGGAWPQETTQTDFHWQFQFTL